MENTNTEEVFPSKPFFDAKFIISAIGVIIVVFSYISYAKPKAQPAPTLDQRISTLKQLRDEKAAHLKNIENEQKAIYLIDQKIVPLKCWVFNDVQAKQQWELECKDFYVEQQSKIKSQTWEVMSSVEDLSDE